MPQHSTRIHRKCPVCGTEFITFPCRIARGAGNYCSRACFYTGGQVTPRRPLLERLWSKTVVECECWVWHGSRNPQGYGSILVGSVREGTYRIDRVHRASFREHFGSLPADADVCHKCDNPPCWRPEHLFLGTAADNIADALSKGRIPVGEDAAKSKLTNAQVAEIRSRHTTGGISQTQLAAEYGVSQSAVNAILYRKAWKWIK
jgi:hypothetical protein